MGSGGPRGLQILLSVADRGRGGFDSHTFPPLFLALFWIAIVAGPVHAQASPDTTVGEKHRPWHEQPSWIMARSAVVPGWGQFKNGRPLKAGVAIVAEGAAAYAMIDAWKDVDAASQREDEALANGDAAGAAKARAEYENAYTRRSNAGWILGAIVALSMLDAYVDAHMIQFDADFGPDPALPDDASSATLGSPEARLSLCVKF